MATELKCSSCGADLAEGDRFCGACGRPTGEHASIPTNDSTELSRRVQLVRIQGGGGDGDVYSVDAGGTYIGRTDGQISFPDDFFMSPRHMCIRYDEGRVWLEDNQSENGVFF